MRGSRINVPEAVDAVITGPVRDRERLVIENAHETRQRRLWASSRGPPDREVATATNGAASISLR